MHADQAEQQFQKIRIQMKANQDRKFVLTFEISIAVVLKQTSEYISVYDSHEGTGMRIELQLSRQVQVE